MEEKEVATVRKITGEIIGGFFLYGLLFGAIYYILSAFVIAGLSEKVTTEPINLIWIAIITTILYGFAWFAICKCSIATTFRKRAIAMVDVNKVMRNIIIISVILYVIGFVFNIIDINSTMKEIDEINNSLGNSIYARIAGDEYDNMIIEAQRQINDIKSNAYIALAISEIGSAIIYFGVILLNKKSIMKHAV